MGGVAVAADTSKAVIGVTPVAIHSKFASVIYNNLNNSSATLRLSRMSDREVQDLAYAYERNTGVVNDLTGLIRVRAPTQVARFMRMAANAVAAWANTNQVYRSRMKVTYGPAPTLDMTLQEIYLEFRTAPVGSLSVEAATFSTAAYAMINLTAAWTAGYIIGSGIHWVIQTYSPSLDNQIGATMDWTLNNLAAAGTSITLQGYAEYQMDYWSWGVSLATLSFGADFGDFGLFDVMSEFFYVETCVNPGWC